MKSLSLAENQLSDLSGFENELFPQLTLLDIKGNQFNCSYLQRFIKSLSWDKLRLPVDPESVKPGETRIRSIKCHQIIQSKLEVEEPNYKILDKDSKNTKSMKSHSDIYLIFLCIIMLAFLIMFVFANQGKIFGQTDGRNAYERQAVEYKNEDLLLK